MRRIVVRILAGVVSAALVVAVYVLGMHEGRNENRVTPSDVSAFAACMAYEQPLRAQDSGPVNYGPCFQDTILGWQR